MRELPIAVFDSGLGGISVLRELVKCMPQERFLYFGDSANAPYGSRPTEEIRDLTLRNAEMLFNLGAKALVVACNTATSSAIHVLRVSYPDHIIIGIEPALRPAVTQFPNGKVIVMATDATLREQKFAALMAQYEDACEIFKCPCPELVAFVERGELESKALYEVLRKRLSPLPKPDAVVLGCTHYPFLRKAIANIVGANCEIFDGAVGTARETKRRLQEANLLRETTQGEVCFLNSLQTQGILDLSEKLLRLP